MHQTSATSEFELIQRYFAGMTATRSDVSLGIGDDAALVRIPSHHQLAVSVDTLVSGVHFFPSVAPEHLAHKALAVNLSDLAAMGAEPAWATLALTLPESNAVWLEAFAKGFAALAEQYGVQLIGGDTTRGPLSITVQVLGRVPDGQALRRAGARPHDHIYVTGELGDAALCLNLLQSGGMKPPAFEHLQQRLERPQPRVEAGLALRQVASSAIDLSDGLLADLGHILQASGLGARIELERLPLSTGFSAWLADSGDWSPALNGGDDYELCFTAERGREAEIQRIAGDLDLKISRIGTIDPSPGLLVVKADGTPWTAARQGFDHFSGAE
ncbi:MAG: thiamine-phosphate kinase [Candidatus Thiodiazotropha sp.]